MNIEIYNIDSLEYMKNMKDKSIDLIITDPPYNVHTDIGKGDYKGIKSSLKQLDKANIIDSYDITTFNKEFVRIMKEINIYIYGVIRNKL